MFATDDMQPEQWVGLAATLARWQVQERGSSNGRENLNRFGGEPASIQHFEYEPCPDCGRSMTFIGQLDRG
jgi:hypothetical protein